LSKFFNYIREQPLTLYLLITKTLASYSNHSYGFPVVLYGCKTWSLTLKEEQRQCFEKRVLRRAFEPKREEDGSWRKLRNDELHNLYSSPNIDMMRERDMCHSWGREEVFTGFGLGGPKVRDHWEDPGIGGRTILRWTLGTQGSMGRNGFGWLRIGSSGGRLRKWY
jgi:hypothetical protein